MKIAMSDLREY